MSWTLRRISKTNKQQREESQFLSSHKGLTCPYGHKDVAANPASEGRYSVNKALEHKHNYREQRTPVHTLSAKTQITFVCVLSDVSSLGLSVE